MNTPGTVPPNSTEDALLRRLRAGDPQALEPIYRSYRGPVYRFALLWSGTTSVAADVTQDVFMHLLTRPDDFDPLRGALLPWLLGIARNFCRRRTGTPMEQPVGDPASLEESALTSPLASTACTPLDALLGREDLERLRAAIATLPPHYRDVLILIELAERSYVDAALICGCELNTVRSRLSRARALLAKQLAPAGDRP